MTHTTVAPAARLRPFLRWMVSFVGYPLGGLLAMVVIGRVDSSASAALGGLLSGAVLGCVQAWALRFDWPRALRWVAATAVGLSIGLAAGATLVGFGATLPQLAAQGAVCGMGVGVGQAVVVARRLGRVAALWPVYLAAVWALGWSVTTSIGVQVDERFTVFGSAGAVVAAGLTYILPVALRRADSR